MCVYMCLYWALWWTKTCLWVLVQVTILDYSFTNFINFEAEIDYPEHGGVIQVYIY